jgi:hypothetical protein
MTYRVLWLGHVALAFDLKRRNINIVIQDSCILSSLVNKCIPICTPSIYLVVLPCQPPYSICKLYSYKEGYLESKYKHITYICHLLKVILCYLLKSALEIDIRNYVGY